MEPGPANGQKAWRAEARLRRAPSTNLVTSAL
jgi:hypothetical protein